MIEIILCTYQGVTYLREQIDSILSSNRNDILLTIRDDGSTDGTKEVIQEYQLAYPQIIRERKKEERLGAAKNFLIGAKESKADYVMFCDQDDVWDQDKISVTIKAMKKLEDKYERKTALAVFGDARITDKNLKVISSSFFKSNHLNPKKRDLASLLIENKLPGCTVMINRALCDKLLILPNSVRLHDWWIALIAAAFGHIGYINRPLLSYRQHEENVVGSNHSYIKYIKNRLLTIKEQKKSLRACILQAEEFLQLYQGALGKRERRIVESFVSLQEKGFLQKRLTLFHSHFYKTGLLRNIGVFLII